MQKEKDVVPSDSSKSDATSNDTLADIEDTQVVTDSPDAGSNDPLAPDGSIPSRESERNSRDDVDPM